jgi:hypothetical protein
VAQALAGRTSWAIAQMKPASSCLGARLKPPQRLVEAWAKIHRAELEQDWVLLRSGKPPSRSNHSGSQGPAMENDAT